MNMILSLLARFAPSLLPGLGAFLNPWVLLAVAAVAAGVWFHGYSTGRDTLDAYVREQAINATRVIIKQGAVTERVVTKYIKVKGDTQVVTETVEKEVVRYAETNPAGICLDPDWQRLHDGAALNTLPAAAGGAAGGLRAPAAPAQGLRPR